MNIFKKCIKSFNSYLFLIYGITFFYCNKVPIPEKFIFEDIHKIPYDGGPGQIAIENPDKEDTNIALSLNILSALCLKEFLYPSDVSDASKKRAGLQKKAEKYENNFTKLGNKANKDSEILNEWGGGIDSEILKSWKDAIHDTDFDIVRSSMASILASIRAKNTLLKANEGRLYFNFLKLFLKENNETISVKNILEYIFRRLGIKKFYTLVTESKGNENNIKIQGYHYFLNTEFSENTITKRIENTLDNLKQKIYNLPEIEDRQFLIVSTKSSDKLSIYNATLKKKYISKAQGDQFFNLKFFVINDTFYINLNEKGWMKSKINEKSEPVTQAGIRNALKGNKELLLFYEKI